MTRAFTLLELIISIIIIGIASAGLPMIIAAANKSDEYSINQDIAFKSTSVMNDVISRLWDSVMYNESSVLVVAVPNSQDANLKLNPRPGNFGRTQFDDRVYYSDGAQASTITTTTHPLVNTDQATGIDWYNGRFIDETAGSARVRYDMQVRYVDERPTATNGTTQNFTWNLTGGGNTDVANSTNLKRVVITATRTMGSGEVYTNSFSYFTSNIGSQELKKQ